MDSTRCVLFLKVPSVMCLIDACLRAMVNSLGSPLPKPERSSPKDVLIPTAALWTIKFLHAELLGGSHSRDHRYAEQEANEEDV